MGRQGDFNTTTSIEKLLQLKGTSRLEVSDEIVEEIQALEEKLTPGCRLRFLLSKKYDPQEQEGEGGWTEYKALFKIKKYQDSFEYLSFALENLSKILKNLRSRFKDKDLDIGIQEVYCEDPCSYYFLFYILN